MVMGDMEMSTDLLVIGGGPGGYSAAFRAAELGLDVILADPRPQLGGTCLHAGCIASKTLLNLAQLLGDTRRAGKMGLRFQEPDIDLVALRNWQQKAIQDEAEKLRQLAKNRGVLLVHGRVRFVGSKAVRLTDAEISGIKFKQAIIAVGSRPRSLPGATFSPGGRIMDSAAALTLSEVPQSLLVVGGGYIGLEIASIYAALGSRVTLMEMQNRLLAKADPDLVAPLQARLDQEFAAIHIEARIDALQETTTGVIAHYTHRGEVAELAFDKVLLAIGRVPNCDDLGLEHTGVSLDDYGFIKIDEQQRTTDQRIFAVGDVTGGVMLAHKAVRQGRVAAETISGRKSAFDVRAIPALIHTDPQIAWCGLSEEDARHEGVAHAVKRSQGHHPERFSKFVTNPTDGRILGAGVVSRDAQGSIGEAALAIEMGTLFEDLSLVLHPFPLLYEIEDEAAEILVR